MKERPTISRREFIERSSLGVGGLILSTILVGSCRKDDDPPGNPDQKGSFDYGVASFDPTESKVILWTRITPGDNAETVALTYDLADDQAFSNIIKTEKINASAGDDFTVSIDISGLNSNTKYYYRFSITGANITSVTGETKTLPKGGELSEVRLAVCSCSNYPSGLFNVYGAMAASEADVILHLGDYIYEYGDGQYGTNENTAKLNRAHMPKTEILSLSDYRTRYRQYRSDPQLQLAHQKKPFICVWDDHELANDAYKDGAQNHNTNEGSFSARKESAIKAYHEYIGARTTSRARIYRSFSFGNILDLHMLDTRVIGRDKQLSYANYQTSSGLDAAAFQKDWLDPKRTILGSEQLTWLGAAIQSGKGAWQVLGQQVLMGKMYVPAELLAVIAQIMQEIDTTGSANPATFLKLQASLTELTQLKTRLLANDPTLTPQQIARVKTVLPYNLDAWDGYPVEREAVYAMATGKQLIALSGDSHNGWYSDLTAGNSPVTVGKELATSSVTSPGFEQYLGADPKTLGGFEQALALLVDDLKYLDASRRGYVMAKFTTARVVSEWRYVGTISGPDTATTVGHSETITPG